MQDLAGAAPTDEAPRDAGAVVAGEQILGVVHLPPPDDADSTAGDVEGRGSEDRSKGVSGDGDASRRKKEAILGGPATERGTSTLRKESWLDFRSFLGAASASTAVGPSLREKMRRMVSSAKAGFPGWLRRRMTFYRIHFAVFFLLMMLGTLVIYASPNGSTGRLPFIDCMYVATSALCVTGLINVQVDQLSNFDWVVLIVLMLIGNQVFTSLIPVFVRKHYFKKYLESEDSSSDYRSRDESSSRLALFPTDSELRLGEAATTPEAPATDEAGVSFEPQRSEEGLSGSPGPTQQPYPGLPSRSSQGSASLTGSLGGTARTPVANVDSPWDFLITPDEAVLAGHERRTWAGETAAANATRLKRIMEASRMPGKLAPSRTLPPIPQSMTGSFLPREDSGAALDASTLAPGERRLIELRALEMLSWLVPAYLLGILLSCFVLLIVCLVANPYYMSLLQQNGTNVAFMAAVQTVGGFAQAGFSLFDANMVPFQAYCPYLLIVAVLVLLGNTCYAPTLRLLLYIISRFGTEHQRFVASYLLEHPRRCYTHLFPRSDTRWLVFSVVLFNTAQFVAFLALDWNSLALKGLTPAVKVLDAFFQSVSTRSPGYNVVSLALLSPAMNVLTIGFMYVAVYPVYITRQRSREQREVYHDEDLQIFYEDLEGGVMDRGVLGQTKKMLSRDSALLFFSVFFVCVIEQNEILTDPANYSIFSIVFEIIGAYGNVGLSLGYTCQPQFPNCDPVPFALSGLWSPGAKFILILVMFLGRHRGLPDDIDAAIVIPDRKQFRLEHPQPEENAPLLTRMQSVVHKTPQRTSSATPRRAS